ncbi:MAG: carboxypeptidase regulatory-like domain-containing protein [Planctomycetes bacterium]|nr:carboxypeptidase regulatory-like domain-containing protein [Planctomycetota bacterium]
MKLQRLVLGVGLVLVLAVAWWLRPMGSGTDGAPVASSEPQATGPSENAGAAASAASQPTDATPTSTVDSAKQPIAPRFRIQVLDAQHAPVEGAELSLTPLSVVELGLVVDSEAAERVRAASVDARSDATGWATFALPPDFLGTSGKLALWTTAPGFLAEVRLLASLEALSSERPIELHAGAPTELRVGSADGGRVADAKVHVTGWVPAHVAPTLSSEEFAARRAFGRTLAMHDGASRASFSTDFTVAAVASDDGWRSSRRVGALNGRIAFTLHPTFTLSGRCRVAPGAALPKPATVQVGTVTADLFDWTAAVSTRIDGTFGPSECPLVPGSTYGFMLQLSDARSEVVHRPAPQRGEKVEIEFAPEAGDACTVAVLGTDGEPVQNVAITCYWDGGVNAFETHSAPALTDELGIAVVHILRTGSIWFRAEKPGYAVTRVGPVLLTEDSDRHVEIVLREGGTLEGRVTSNGQPVEDFEITYWPGSDPDQMRIVEFAGRTDGSFSIEGVFAIAQNVFARSKTLPRSEIRSVPFVGGKAGPVELELSESLSAFGTVVDAESRRPIEGASVTVWAAWQAMIISQQGDEARTDASGRFELAGLRAGRNPLWVQASGYHWAQPHVDATPGAPTDLGTIPLQRGFPIDFALVADEPMDWTKFALETRFQVITPTTPFDASGTFRIEDCTRAPILFVVTYPDDTTATMRVNVRGPELNRFEHRVPNDTTLMLEVSDGTACPVPPVLDGFLAYARPDGVIVERFFSVRDGRGTVANLPTGTAMLTLFSPSGGVLRRRVVLGPKTETRIEAPLTCKQRTLRFVEHDGSPRVSVAVNVSCVDEEPRVLQWATTDDQGRITIPDPECGRVAIAVLGVNWKLGLVVDLLDVEEQVVDLGADATLAVRLVDGEDRLGGRVVCATDPITDMMLLDVISDPHGVARWEGLYPTEYLVRVFGQGLWPTTATLTSRAPTDPPHELQVRRVGGVTVEVRGSLGEPIAGAELELVSTEFGTSLSQWIESGELPASTPRTTTTDGRLSLSGLPRGGYTWTVTRPDGGSQSGVVEIAPATATKVDVAFAN